MKLVVGLGNPGRRYQGTRHNIGWAVLAELAAQVRRRRRPKPVFRAKRSRPTWKGEKALLLTPSTYMNLSGASVLAARDFYKIPNEDLLVVCDDLNLPVAKLRIRAGGSSGGQKGLEDIIRRLGTRRVRPAADRHRDAAGRLGLGRLRAQQVFREEIADVELAVARAAERRGRSGPARASRPA